MWHSAEQFILFLRKIIPMYQLRKITIVVLLVSSAFISCRKNDSPSNEEKPMSLLRKIEWNVGLVSQYEYNSDSTLRQIASLQRTISSLNTYTHTNKRVTEVNTGHSLYTNKFYYTGDLLTSIINASIHPTLPDSYKLEYEYDNKKRLSRLLYYDIHEGGQTLKASSTYLYNAEGLPTKISTQSGAAVINTYVDAYSDQHRFNPWVFMAIGLSENYTLYNYPVLRNAQRLPAIIRTTRINPGQPEVLEKTVTNIYFIHNLRLDSVKSSVVYDTEPQYNSSFSYKLLY